MSKVDEEVGLLIRASIILGLADAEGLDAGEIEEAVALAGGDAGYQLDSKMAEAVIAYVEDLYGCELPSPADLRKDQFATLEAIVTLISPAIPNRLDV